jgi:hypothetical protein
MSIEMPTFAFGRAVHDADRGSAQKRASGVFDALFTVFEDQEQSGLSAYANLPSSG